LCVVLRIDQFAGIRQQPVDVRVGDRLDIEPICMRQGISGGLRDLFWDCAAFVNAKANRIAPDQQISAARLT